MSSTTDWLMVIITTIYVIATILICVYNGKSAKAAQEQTKTAKKQIEEMLKQYNDSNRPIVTLRFAVIRGGLLCFIVENVGPKVATNVNVRFGEAFINNLPEEYDRNNLNSISKAHFLLSSKQKQYIMFGAQPQLRTIGKEIAIIDISYNGEYHEHLEIDLLQYGSMLSYSSELDDIAKSIDKLEKENKDYKKNLIKTMKNNAASNVFTIEENSSKYRVFKEVCSNRGVTALQISETVGIAKEEALEILLELANVNGLIYYSMAFEDEYTANWYKRV